MEVSKFIFLFGFVQFIFWLVCSTFKLLSQTESEIDVEKNDHLGSIIFRYKYSIDNSVGFPLYSFYFPILEEKCKFLNHICKQN